MARPTTFPIAGSAAQNAAALNGMQDGLRSNRDVYGSQGSPVVGSPYVVYGDFKPATPQLFGLVSEIYAGSDILFGLRNANVAAGEESWLTIVFRQVGGPWDLSLVLDPFAGWTILTEGNATLLPSASANTIDIFDLWTPNGTDWFGAVTKAWS